MADRGRVVHGLPQQRRQRSPRCAATASGSSPAICSAPGSPGPATWPSPPARASGASTSPRTPRRHTGRGHGGHGPRGARPTGRSPSPSADRTWPARNVNMGNPHAVAFVDDLADAGDLLRAPAGHARPRPTRTASTSSSWWTADRATSPLRVHERGSGETRSCGTGRVRGHGGRRPQGRRSTRRSPGSRVTYTVDVPGGRLVITEQPDGEIEMTGPAVIVAEGVIDAAWLRTEHSTGRGARNRPRRSSIAPDRALRYRFDMTFPRTGDPSHARREAVSAAWWAR